MERALIVKKKWADKILSGEKTWEIRGHNTKIRGTVGIIESGTGLIVGECYISDSRKFCMNKWAYVFEKHCVDFSGINYLRYKKPYAWFLEDAKRYEKPIPYNHPQGAVIWVKINKSEAE